MSNIRSQGNLDQGEGDGGGGYRTKSNGSHLDVAKDVVMQGSTGDHLGQGRSGGANTTRPSGSNLVPSDWNVPSSDGTSVRGGGTVRGHGREDVTAGKSKSGSKNAQHPNVTVKKIGASGTYLGK